jgi:hypothetical protein
MVQREPGVSAWNRRADGIARASSMFSSGSRLARRLLQRRMCRTQLLNKEDVVMKRTSALAVSLGTILIAGAASAGVGEEIQAPRSSSQDIQAPRTTNDDIQAPRSESQDIQAPRTKSEDIQAPRSGNEDIQAPRG